MRSVAVACLTLLLFLPGLITPAGRALGYTVNTKLLHHLIEGDSIASAYGDEDDTCQDCFSVDPTQCDHAHMVMAAIPAVIASLPDPIRPTYSPQLAEVGRRVLTDPLLRPPQA